MTPSFARGPEPGPWDSATIAGLSTVLYVRFFTPIAWTWYVLIGTSVTFGVGLLAGAALSYESLSIFIYAGLFFLVTHLFVVLYEEPTLRRTFGSEYEAYCDRVKRWLPKQSTK